VNLRARIFSSSELLGTRRDALTGVVLAEGSRRQLDRYLRRRACPADGADWYAEARRLLDTEARDAGTKEDVR
jgi:hypothetical protein